MRASRPASVGMRKLCRPSRLSFARRRGDSLTGPAEVFSDNHNDIAARAAARDGSSSERSRTCRFSRFPLGAGAAFRVRIVSSPVLMAVDDDADALSDVERELRDRYARHYRVVCMSSSSLS